MPSTLASRFKCLALLPLILLVSGAAISQEPSEIPFSQRYVLHGKVAPKPASEISNNLWSVGGETLDRAYSTYDRWKAYLGPLGVKRIRLQAGWSQVERQRGEYDFSVLDSVIADAVSQGVTPWINLSYGNPAYEGGGTGLHDSDLPHDEAFDAWLNFVRELVTRYNGRVNEWEIWNEPERWTGTTPEGYASFAYETAKVIKATEPDAFIVLGGFSAAVLRQNASKRPFADATLRAFTEMAGAGYAGAVSYHGYSENPDSIYGAVASFRVLLNNIDPSLALWQGEAGAPSLNQPQFAMRDNWWTEEAQAKWILRRMIADAARSISTSIFTMVDLHYDRPVDEFGEEITAEFGPLTGSIQNLNTKGLLETTRYAPGTPDDDQSVLRPKMAYRAVQSLTAILNASLVAGEVCTSTDEAVVGYSFKDDKGRSMVALWRNVGIPGQNPEHIESDILCPGTSVSPDAYYVDLLTTAVYRIRDDLSGSDLQISNLPLYDSPILIVDASLVEVW